MHSRLKRWPVLVLACWAAASLAAPDGARGVIDDTTEPSGNCAFSLYNSFSLDANLSLVGVRVPNSSIKVEAANAMIVARRTTGTRLCDALIFQIPSFRWTVDAPPGQTAEVTNGGTLSP